MSFAIQVVKIGHFKQSSVNSVITFYGVVLVNCLILSASTHLKNDDLLKFLNLFWRCITVKEEQTKLLLKKLLKQL